MFALSDVVLRLFGVGREGRIRFIMVAGMAIGTLTIVIAVAHGRASMIVVGALILVASLVFWPWVLRKGRDRRAV